MIVFLFIATVILSWYLGVLACVGDIKAERSRGSERAQRSYEHGIMNANHRVRLKIRQLAPTVVQAEQFIKELFNE